MKILITENQLKKIIREDFVGNMRIKSGGEYGSYEVYLNPQSINKMEPNLRGVLDKNGNLYVVDDSMNVVHFEIIDFLETKGLIKHNDIHISVQRYQYTNDFYLSESYQYESLENMIEDEIGTGYTVEEGIDIIKTVFKQASIRNPTYDFIMETITGNKLLEPNYIE